MSSVWCQRLPCSRGGTRVTHSHTYPHACILHLTHTHTNTLYPLPPFELLLDSDSAQMSCSKPDLSFCVAAPAVRLQPCMAGTRSERRSLESVPRTQACDGGLREQERYFWSASPTLRSGPTLEWLASVSLVPCSPCRASERGSVAPLLPLLLSSTVNAGDSSLRLFVRVSSQIRSRVLRLSSSSASCPEEAVCGSSRPAVREQRWTQSRRRCRR